MQALSIVSTVSTACFALGSFCLGVAANILVGYGGAEKLTDMGAFMLHVCTPTTGIAALSFYSLGVYFHYQKGSLWKTIKSESRQITPHQQ
jgi:hypothetical protein